MAEKRQKYAGISNTESDDDDDSEASFTDSLTSSQLTSQSHGSSSLISGDFEQFTAVRSKVSLFIFLDSLFQQFDKNFLFSLFLISVQFGF